MTNIAIIKLYQFTHSPRRQRVDMDKGPEGDAVAAAAIMTCSSLSMQKGLASWHQDM